MSISPHYYSTVGRSTSSFSGFFIDFQRSDADRRFFSPTLPLGEDVYKVPCFCDDPVALKNFCDREDAYFPERTYQWLTNYQPLNEGMRKAKNFWLKTQKYSDNSEAREEIRDAYPQEVAELGHQIWKKHCQVDSENWINAGYYLKYRPNMPMPEEFASLDHYHQLEPGDRIPYGHADRVSVLLESYKPVSEWTLDTEDFQLIETHLPHKVEDLKQILWHRHLALEAKREEERLEASEKVKTALKIAALVIAPVSFIGFTSAAIFMFQPLFLIPAFAVIAVAMLTTIYFSRAQNAN